MISCFDYQGNIITTPIMSVPWQSDVHRGYTSQTVAENTLQAFYRAYKNTANWIEVDARLSSDAVYVCSHEATVTVDNVTYTIAEETAETLTSLVLSTDPIYGECKLPTLESVLKLCVYTGMTANIDCKNINPETLAKLVIDSGMSGRALYANLSTTNAGRILAVDPNAGFIFYYDESDLETWKSYLTDYIVRNRSYVYDTSINHEKLEKTRTAGFKFLLSNVSTTTNMIYNPDAIQFRSEADIKTLNESYLNSIDLGI